MKFPSIVCVERSVSNRRTMTVRATNVVRLLQRVLLLPRLKPMLCLILGVSRLLGITGLPQPCRAIGIGPTEGWRALLGFYLWFTKTHNESVLNLNLKKMLVFKNRKAVA